MLLAWQAELREELESLLGFNQQVQLVVEQLEDTCRSIQVRVGVCGATSVSLFV